MTAAERAALAEIEALLRAPPPPRTHRQIAKRLGCSREWVRKLEARALAKMADAAAAGDWR